MDAEASATDRPPGKALLVVVGITSLPIPMMAAVPLFAAIGGLAGTLGIVGDAWDLFGVSLAAGVAGMANAFSLVLTGIVIVFARWRKTRLGLVWLLPSSVSLALSVILIVICCLLAGRI